MSTTMVIQYTTHPGSADENERLIRAVFDELAATRPEGVRYTASRLADGVGFVHVVVVEGDDNPIPEMPAFQAFQANIGDRCASPPSFSEGTVVGTYG